jgi:hypothetical protein
MGLDLSATPVENSRDSLKVGTALVDCRTPQRGLEKSAQSRKCLLSARPAVTVQIASACRKLPQAHEDDAERDVRAALELVAAVNDLS